MSHLTSHLDSGPVGVGSAEDHISSALPGMSGLGADSASVPAVAAPIQPISPLMINVLLLGGAALITYLVLRSRK